MNGPLIAIFEKKAMKKNTNKIKYFLKNIWYKYIKKIILFDSNNVFIYYICMDELSWKFFYERKKGNLKAFLMVIIKNII